MKYIKEFQINEDSPRKHYQSLLNDETKEITKEHIRTDKFNNLFVTVWYQDKEY